MNIFHKIERTVHQFFIPNEENNFRPKSLERQSFLVYILIALVFKLGIMSFFSVLPKTVFYADIARLALVNLTNEARVSRGLLPLTENATLEKAAQAKAHDILAKGYFAHESPDGKTPWYWFLEAGYKYLYAGENLAIDFVESTDVVQAWLASPGHRANIENKNYRDIGIAVVTGKFGDDPNGANRVVVVQLFGNPVPAATTLPSPKAPVTTIKPVLSLSPLPLKSATPLATQKPRPTPKPAQTSPPTSSSTPGPTAIVVLSTAPASRTSQNTSPTSSPATVAAIEPGTGNVLGLVQLPLGDAAQPSRVMRFSAKFMTATERFAENIFFAFLAFVILASLLNVVIRHDIQHADLLARTFILTIFFLMLVATRNQTFLSLTPGIL